MKYLFINLYTLLAFIPCLAGGTERDTLHPLISIRRVAVVLIDFPDIPVNIRKQFPAVKEAKDYFFNPSVKKYFSTISWGKFDFDGDVFGYFTMPDSLTEKRRNNDTVIKITERYNLNIPEFSPEKFDCLAFVVFHDKHEQRGLSQTKGANYTVNGRYYEKQDVMYIGAFINDSTSTFTRPFTYRIRYGEGPADVEEVEYPIKWKYNQVIWVHEFIHLINGKTETPHANSCTNNGKHDYEQPDTTHQPKRFLNLEYGNKYDIMGSGALALSLTGQYRKTTGWCDSSNFRLIDKRGRVTVKINPINRSSGIRVVQIHIPCKSKNDNYQNGMDGYFLEVREADTWDASLHHPKLGEITKGILVHKSDGYISMLLDMSPSKNFSDKNDLQKQWVDYRDMALKPDMIYENNEIRLSNVRRNSDGSFFIDVLVK